MSTITINNLTMKFKETVALDDLSLTFKENKIYGLLGRNGAGKSTLLNLITNKLFPTSGSIEVDGQPVKENRAALSKIYCMSEQSLYPDDCRIKNIFRWSGEFYPNFDAEYASQLSDLFQLDVKKKVKGLSTGYSSIYKIIIALSCNAEIILLDEPVLGLDANHRELFYKELIKVYSEKPRTFVLSTHLIEEVANLIENVVIIKDGRLLIDDTTENVRAMGYGVSGKAADVDSFTKGKNIISEEVLGALKTSYLLEPKPVDIPESIEVSPLDLQQLFIKLTSV